MMVPLTALWLPILVSAVLVFVASSIIHMLLPYHRGDYRQIPNEAQAMSDLRRAGVTPGDYVIPYARTPKEMNTPEYKERFNQGPVVLMSVASPGQSTMSRSLVLWFVFSVIVGIFAAYVAGRALPPGAPYGEAFRFTSTVAFAGYGLALWEMAIWFHRSWRVTITSTFDALIYALLTGGSFGWLWPA